MLDDIGLSYENIDIESIGNGEAELVINNIKRGSVSGVEVDDVGTLYEVGDTLTFTAASTDTDVKSASGFVSMVGGGILQETGTLDDSDITTDVIRLEDGTDSQLVPFEFILEDGNLIQEEITPDSSTKVFTLTSINAKTDHNRIFRDNSLLNSTNDQGSTVGLTIVHDKSELGAALNLAFNYSSSVMVEQFIEGREFTVTFIEGKVLPVCEIIPSHELYDYECKYQGGMSKYICPAELPAELASKLAQSALLLHKALGCRHYSRTDFRLSQENNFFCLEINTLPVLTKTSHFPMACL